MSNVPFFTVIFFGAPVMVILLKFWGASTVLEIRQSFLKKARIPLHRLTLNRTHSFFAAEILSDNETPVHIYLGQWSVHILENLGSDGDRYDVCLAEVLLCNQGQR